MLADELEVVHADPGEKSGHLGGSEGKDFERGGSNDAARIARATHGWSADVQSEETPATPRRRRSAPKTSPNSRPPTVRSFTIRAFRHNASFLLYSVVSEPAEVTSAPTESPQPSAKKNPRYVEILAGLLLLLALVGTWVVL